MNKREPNIQCSHESLNLDNSSKKTEFKKIFLISNSTLDELFNDTTHISLRWIYRSAKIHGTKKNPFEYIVPPPYKWGRNNYLVMWNNNLCYNCNCLIEYNSGFTDWDETFKWVKKCMLIFFNFEDLNETWQDVVPPLLGLSKTCFCEFCIFLLDFIRIENFPNIYSFRFT